MVTYEGVHVRTCVASGAQSVNPLSTQGAQFQLFLQNLHPFFPHFVEESTSSEKLHPQSNEPKIFVSVLKLEHSTDSFIFHDIFNIDGQFREGGVSDDFDFGASDCRENQLTVYFLMSGPANHDILLRMDFLVLLSYGFNQCDFADSLHNLKALDLQLHHTILFSWFRQGLRLGLLSDSL